MATDPVTTENVLFERDGHLAIITVNRPSKLNALDNQTIAELDATFASIDIDDSVGAVIVTGAGKKAFVAGADISEIGKQGVLDGTENSRRGQALTLRMESCSKPVLAAINGFALGGGLELALACDVRFAPSNAKLGLPEVSLGVIPGYGGTQRLPRLVGIGNALGLILQGDAIDAQEALRIGLVNGVFEPEELMDKVKAIANRMVMRGPTALSMAKQAVQRGAQMPMRDALNLEADLFGMISSTDEFREGMTAFLEKRKPSWLRK
ncbi:MAG: enoyl-CoA hydratase [Planctomycetota bacterium]|jgi:enoyl-CoA hydratase